MTLALIRDMFRHFLLMFFLQGSAGDTYREGCPFARFGINRNGPLVFFDDFSSYYQAQASPFRASGRNVNFTQIYTNLFDKMYVTH